MTRHYWFIYLDHSILLRKQCKYSRKCLQNFWFYIYTQSARYKYLLSFSRDKNHNYKYVSHVSRHIKNNHVLINYEWITFDWYFFRTVVAMPLVDACRNISNFGQQYFRFSFTYDSPIARNPSLDRFNVSCRLKTGEHLCSILFAYSFHLFCCSCFSQESQLHPSVRSQAYWGSNTLSTAPSAAPTKKLSHIAARGASSQTVFFRWPGPWRREVFVYGRLAGFLLFVATSRLGPGRDSSKIIKMRILAKSTINPPISH